MLMSVFISLLLPAAGANLATALTSHLRCCVIWSAAVLCGGVVWCYGVEWGIVEECCGVLSDGLRWSVVLLYGGVV